MSAPEEAILLLNPADNVGVALRDLAKGEKYGIVGGECVQAEQAVPFGHKIAVKDIDAGAPIIKYGEVLGAAFTAISRGEWVHAHNLHEAPEFESPAVKKNDEGQGVLPGAGLKRGSR